MNFQTICRICSCKKSGLTSIFESHNFTESKCKIFKIITICATVQITKTDGFSQQICRKCLDLLSQAYSFKKLCEASDYKFRNHLVVSEDSELEDEQCDDKLETRNECNKVQDRRNNNEQHIASSNGEVGSIEYEESSGLTDSQFPDNDTNSYPDFIYNCSPCSKSWTTKEDLDVQMKIHTEQRLHKLCDDSHNKFKNEVVVNEEVEMKVFEEDTSINFGEFDIDGENLGLSQIKSEQSDKEEEKLENKEVDTTILSSGALESIEQQKTDVTKLPHIENVTSSNPTLSYYCEQYGKTLASKKYLNIDLKIHTEQQVDKLDEESDNKCRNDLIVIEEIEMKLSGEVTSFNVDEIDSDDENTDENIGLAQVKSEQSDKEDRIESKEVDSTTLSIGAFENMKRQDHASTNLPQIENDTISNPDLLYKCEQCDKTLATKEYLDTHMKNHIEQERHKSWEINTIEVIVADTPQNKSSNVQDDVEVEDSSKEKLTSVRVSIEGKQFNCEFCSKKYMRKNSLMRHVKTHKSKKEFPLCRKKRTKPKPKFHCNLCGKKFTEKGNLNRHLKIHSGELYTCDHCKKKFNDKSNLRKHIKLHY